MGHVKTNIGTYYVIDLCRDNNFNIQNLSTFLRLQYLCHGFQRASSVNREVRICT